MANGFGAPPSPYPDTGGQDLPQPGTPEWAALMARLSGQGPMPGQIPGQGMFSTTTPTAGGGNQPPPGPLALPGATAATPVGGSAGPVVGDNALAALQKSYDRAYPPAPPKKPPAKRVPPVTPVADPSMLYPWRTAVAGSASPTAPPGPGGGGEYGQADPRNPIPVANRPAPAITPVADPDMLYPHRMIAGAPSNGAVPNLGYYTGPTSGNVQQASSFRYTDPNDPRIFRGPLASQPAAPAPGPIAPGAGAPWWQKLFGGGQPT